MWKLQIVTYKCNLLHTLFTFTFNKTWTFNLKEIYTHLHLHIPSCQRLFDCYFYYSLLNYTFTMYISKLNNYIISFYDSYCVILKVPPSRVSVLVFDHSFVWFYYVPVYSWCLSCIFHLLDLGEYEFVWCTPFIPLFWWGVFYIRL